MNIFSGSEIFKILCSDWLRLRPGLQIGCPIADSTRGGLVLLVPSSSSPITTIFIYVDGGHQPNPKDDDLSSCTWGLCVITEHLNGEQVLQGCTGGWVSNVANDGIHAGAVELNSYTAEIQAHLFARLLLLQSSFF